MERIKQNKQTIHTALMGFIVSSSALDMMKKKVMYDADTLKLMKLDAEYMKVLNMFKNDEYLDKISEDEKLSKLFHYIIGCITEQNELVTALVNATLSGKIDTVNFGEEISDSFWYEARLCDILGLDGDSLRQKNIDKLKARFPDKFTEHSANNRDLQTERQILES